MLCQSLVDFEQKMSFLCLFCIKICQICLIFSEKKQNGRHCEIASLKLKFSFDFVTGSAGSVVHKYK